MKMKAARLLEFVGVPLALACVGYNAGFLTTKLIAVLGRGYITTSTMSIFSVILWPTVCGFVAGVVAVVVQGKKAAGQRWPFYGVMALSALVGVGLIFVIEAVRPRFMGINGISAMSPDISSVPFWIISVGFWCPFLSLLGKMRSSAPGTATGQEP